MYAGVAPESAHGYSAGVTSDHREPPKLSTVVTRPGVSRGGASPVAHIVGGQFNVANLMQPRNVTDRPMRHAATLSHECNRRHAREGLRETEIVLCWADMSGSPFVSHGWFILCVRSSSLLGRIGMFKALEVRLDSGFQGRPYLSQHVGIVSGAARCTSIAQPCARSGLCASGHSDECQRTFLALGL